MPERRLNLLLIMADQLGAQWLGAYGHPVVRTPQLDALAARSTVFESAYCPSPLCAPSRASLLTGQLPSRTGVFDNAAEMRASLPTVTHRLRANGYLTALAGKMHFVGPDQLHGFEERLTTDIYPAGLDWTPDWRLPLTDRLPWYHTMESVLRPGVCTASMQQDFDDEVAFRAVRKLHDLAREGPERPFFLTVSFSNPHDPWEIRREHWERYDPGAIDLPAVPPIGREAADPYSLRLRDMCGTDDVELSEEQVRTARHGYYAALSYLDDRVGEVLGALASTGLDGDTAVVFTADHGEMLGERGLWYKMAFFEPSARVPLFVRVPGEGPGRVAEPVSLLDLGATLAALAGAEPDAPGLFDRTGPVVAEYLAEGVRAPAVMVRRGAHKLVVSPGDPDQLYDVAADPHETADLSGDPAHAAVLGELRAEVESRWDLAALERDVLASQAERRAVASALGEGVPTSWDFAPKVDAATAYVRTRADLYDLQRRARLEDPGP
jgi:choline-sulfatase